MKDIFEYTGAIHMHSVFSDGSGKVDEIAGYASESGLDYIMLTDHNTLRALKEGFEHWYDDTLLLVGCEINDKENKNHYLAFGIDEAFSTRISAKEYVHRVKEKGGIGFIAHPHEKRSHMKEHPPYPWTEWSTEEFTGIEIWNHMSEWIENLTDQNKYQFFLHPLRSIVAPTEETLKVWDELSQKRRVVGIGGVDAHAHKYNMLGFVEVEIFPYKVLFKSIRTHILSADDLFKHKNDVSKSKQIIYSALESGNCFFANDYHGDSKGFRFIAEKGKTIYQMGDEIKSVRQVKFKISIPLENAEVRLLRNGEILDTYTKKEIETTVKQQGAYRVEVYLRNKAWIYSNHIRLI
jgi:PHP domain